MFKIELAEMVRDSVTGFTGKVTARTEYLGGCPRYGVEAEHKGDGKVAEISWFDEDRLGTHNG